MTIIRTYKELSRIKTYEDRFQYLRLDSTIGEKTFGFDRYLNQMIYNSPRWRSARDKVLLRDNGNDFGLEGYEIKGRVVVHHMNPLSIEDIERDLDSIYDPEFLISTSLNSHNAVHYGDERLLIKDPIQRLPNDTCPWKGV